MTEQLFEFHDSLKIPVEEAYNVLRTNIQFSGYEKKIKSLAVTSYNSGEGKTSVSINLAISMAKSGLKTLFVDADLRKPATVKHLGKENTSGLTNIILGKSSIEEVTHKTSIENLFFISCGFKPFNPSELISSPRFSEFMQTISEQYDIVILDSSPVGSVIDGAIISSRADGTLLVVKYNHAVNSNLKRMKEQLEKANSHILGVVLNKIDKKEYKNYYDYHYITRKYKSKSEKYDKKVASFNISPV